MTVLDALGREVARVGDFLRGLVDDDGNRPTRCPPMTVLDIASHVLRGASRIREMIAAGPVGTEPEKDAVTYFQYDVASVAPDVVRRAKLASTDFAGPGALARAWSPAWRAALDDARSLVGDPVLPGMFGSMRLSEYLQTRVVEVTVHHMDLRNALADEPAPDPGALEMTADVLRGLLGTDLRPAGVDDVRFVLVGTGREQLSAHERALVGPLAGAFPLLA